MGMYDKCIVTPKSMRNLAYHESELPTGFGERLVLVNDELFPDAGLFITARELSQLPEDVPNQVTAHSHAATQFFILLGEKGAVQADLRIGPETFRVESPVVIRIPANAEHEIRILKGPGMVVSIVNSGTYP